MMCNSYNNGHCNYYGVEVRDLNYKCERGECMTVEKLIVELSKLDISKEIRVADGDQIEFVGVYREYLDPTDIKDCEDGLGYYVIR